MGFLSNIVQMFKVKDLRAKLLFVLGIFLVFRLMANVPVPGIDVAALQDVFAQNQLFGLLNLFTGGALDNFSVVMLGLGPYITAVIVMQLGTMIFPPLERLYKEEGDQGRQKFNQYGRMLTIPFALVQGFAFLTFLERQTGLLSLSAFEYGIALITITAGTVFLMWLGELITEKGIGNGVSLLIFAGIVSAFPSSIQQVIVNIQANPAELMSLLVFAIMSIVIIAGVVFVTQARRNIPVSYAKRVRGNKLYGGVSTYLPLSINPAGVIPIIFALALLTFPGMIAGFFSASEGIGGSVARFIQDFLNPTSAGYGVSFFILVGVFTFFYTAVTFDPKSISTNLQKMGGFVPGVRPGASTANHIMHILNRILLMGALFLGTIAVLPIILQNVSKVQTEAQAFSFLIGGTALLIIVNVVLETMRQIRAQMKMRDYETF